MYPSAVRKLNKNEEKEAVQNTGKLGPPRSPTIPSTRTRLYKLSGNLLL
jgi:hypothetical protein